MKQVTDTIKFNLELGPFTFHVVRETMDDPWKPETKHTVISNMVLPNSQSEDVTWIAVARSAEAFVAASADAGIDIESIQFRNVVKNYLWRVNGIEIPEIEVLKSEREDAKQKAEKIAKEYVKLFFMTILLKAAIEAEEASRNFNSLSLIEEYELYGDVFILPGSLGADGGMGYFGPK